MWNFQHTHAILPLAGRIPSLLCPLVKAHVSFRSSHASKCDYFVIVEFFESFVGFFKSYVKTALCVCISSQMRYRFRFFSV